MNLKSTFILSLVVFLSCKTDNETPNTNTTSNSKGNHIKIFATQNGGQVNSSNYGFDRFNNYQLSSIKYDIKNNPIVELTNLPDTILINIENDTTYGTYSPTSVNIDYYRDTTYLGRTSASIWFKNINGRYYTQGNSPIIYFK